MASVGLNLYLTLSLRVCCVPWHEHIVFNVWWRYITLLCTIWNWKYILNSN